MVADTLRRAENYSRTVTVERFWSSGSAVETIECHVRGEDVHLISDGRGEQRHVLISGGQVYIWYGDRAQSHAAAPAGSGDADAFTGILTYEELLSLDLSQITGAGYTVYDGQQCIYAAYDTGELGYGSVVYISIATGLLMGAERYDGETLNYRMRSSAPVMELPEEKLVCASLIETEGCP